MSIKSLVLLITVLQRIPEHKKDSFLRYHNLESLITKTYTHLLLIESAQQCSLSFQLNMNERWTLLDYAQKELTPLLAYEYQKLKFSMLQQQLNLLTTAQIPNEQQQKRALLQTISQENNYSCRVKRLKWNIIPISIYPYGWNDLLALADKAITLSTARHLWTNDDALRVFNFELDSARCFYHLAHYIKMQKIENMHTISACANLANES